MLLTLPWLGSLLLGRVDIVNGEGVDKQSSKFTIKSFFRQVRAVIVCPKAYPLMLHSKLARVLYDAHCLNILLGCDSVS